MKMFELVYSPKGDMVGIRITGGTLINNVDELESFCKESEKQRIYGDGVHKIATAFGSTDKKMRIWSRSRAGEVMKIQIGKVTLVDIAKWELDLSVDRDEETLEKIALEDGKIPNTPTLVTINDYRAAVYSTKSYDQAQGSKMSFMEGLLSSKHLPTKGFKPAYGGGLIACAADPDIVYEDVISYDISSSYPWSAATTLMPTGVSYTVGREDLPEFEVRNGKLDVGEGNGFIGLFHFKGVQRKSWVRIPMVKTSDEAYCDENAVFDLNGLVSCDLLKMALSPDDLWSMSAQYTWESIEIKVLEVHALKRLPEGIVHFLSDAFEKKQSAKGFARMKAKVAINSIIGCWGIDPFSAGRKMKFENGRSTYYYNKPLEQIWEGYTGVGGDGFTSGGRRTWDFRWAVYACAAARRRIVEAEFQLHKLGLEVLYCDTDSIKMIGDKAVADRVFAALNARAQKLNSEFNLPRGMGKWVDESAGYSRAYFRAKKFYATEDAQGFKSAYIAGIYKEDADSIVQGVSLDDLSIIDEIVIHSSRPDVTMLEGHSFGAGLQEVQRAQLFRYAKKKNVVVEAL